ncbi:MAG: type II toxin-antitoxin system HicB family antitoxin [Defluviitaleaceae bacterium]|nr:type II toxin-antitoxin system HicB family antitoxin [Defluviitaleaceae bacterium]
MKTKLAVICKKQNNGSYFAMCPEISSCFTQADTYEDAINNLKELTELTLQEMDDDDKEFIINSQDRIYMELEVAI